MCTIDAAMKADSADSHATGLLLLGPLRRRYRSTPSSNSCTAPLVLSSLRLQCTASDSVGYSHPKENDRALTTFSAILRQTSYHRSHSCTRLCCVRASQLPLNIGGSSREAAH